MTNWAASKDGTQIAYDVHGSGSPVVLVEGAMGYRGFGFSSHLAELLAPHFTVVSFDRRGRGESTNPKLFAIEREIEDIEALIGVSGGSAVLFGMSSGACLALEATVTLGEKVKKLAMYEAPYDSDEGTQPLWRAYRRDLDSLLAQGRRGDAVALFMRLVGVPDGTVDGMRKSAEWSVFEAVAPTLAYDAAEIGEDRSVPVERAGQVEVPVLVMDGGANLENMLFMHASALSLAEAMPHAMHRSLDGQTHDVNLEVLAPVLIDFFGQ